MQQGRAEKGRGGQREEEGREGGRKEERREGGRQAGSGGGRKGASEGGTRVGRERGKTGGPGSWYHWDWQDRPPPGSSQAADRRSQSAASTAPAWLFAAPNSALPEYLVGYQSPQVFQARSESLPGTWCSRSKYSADLSTRERQMFRLVQSMMLPKHVCSHINSHPVKFCFLAPLLDNAPRMLAQKM